MCTDTFQSRRICSSAQTHGCVRPDVYYSYIVVRLVLACTVFVCPCDYDFVFISSRCLYTAILRKVVGQSARENPERYCGLFLSSPFFKFERMAREATDICVWVLKESNKSRFDSYSVRNSVLIISHITCRDCRVHIFSGSTILLWVIQSPKLCDKSYKVLLMLSP